MIYALIRGYELISVPFFRSQQFFLIQNAASDDSNSTAIASWTV